MRAVIVAALLCACGAEPEPEPDVCDGVTGTESLDVELGTGQESFLAIADNDPVDIIFGPQGGHHIWGAVRVRGMKANAAHVRLAAVAEDGDKAGGGGPLRIQFERADAHQERAGLFIYIDDPAQIDDPWKKYDVNAPPFLNDLAAMGPKWAYWIRVLEDCTWILP